MSLREALEFADAKLRILLSSHLCTEHGSGECSDVAGAREALRRTRLALERASGEPLAGVVVHSERLQVMCPSCGVPVGQPCRRFREEVR